LLKPAGEDVEVMWELFHSKMESVLHYIPKVACFSSWKKNKWQGPINKSIREKIRTKNKLWKNFIDTKDPAIYAQYRGISNIVRKQTRAVYKHEQNEVARLSKENPKKFWNYVNSRRKSRSTISDLVCQDDQRNVSKADTDEKKAVVLSQFFSSVYSIEPPGEFDRLQDRPGETPMDKVKFSITDIVLRLNKLNVNKSSGPDGIHPRLLHETRNEIVNPLKLIFECSFKTKKLPLDWRVANISAIFKKGKKSEVGNYRPVSLTSVVCKIMESII